MQRVDAIRATDFEKRSQCLVEQFDEYVAVDDEHLNGKLTLGENIADLAGLKLSLAALHAAAPPTPEAASAFACQTADNMVRPEEKRCAVW